MFNILNLEIMISNNNIIIKIIKILIIIFLNFRIKIFNMKSKYDFLKIFNRK